MDQTFVKLILDDQCKVLSSDKEETIHLLYGSSSLSEKYLLLPSDVDYSPKEINADEIYLVSDSLVQQQHNTSTSNKDHKYRIHLGTQPGHYKKGGIIFTESEKRHSKIIAVLESFLTSSNVNYDLIKKDAFSNSAWELEPYACIVLSCSKEIAKGLAAIIGLALRQDAIGIYSDDGSPHPVFTISTSDGSLSTKNDALVLMKKIPKHCTCLSAQFDKNARNIELHDFDNTNDKSVSIGRIRTIINQYFGIQNLFQITKSIGQSDLLKKNDYQQAIKQAGLESFSKPIELTRLHDDLYDKPQSI